jgi:hypothetical protein
MRPQKEYKVWDIEYDIDDNHAFPNPPTEMFIAVDIDLDPDDSIGDIISDDTGWCDLGFQYEEI